MWPFIFLAMVQVARGQSNQTCNGTTVADYPSTDPSLTSATGWVRNIGLHDALSDPDIPITAFYTDDSVLGLGIMSYFPPNINVGQARPQLGSAAELGLYMMVQGAQSPDDLVALRSLNSALGQAKGQDWTFTVDREAATGTLLVSSMLPNSTARVLDAQQMCNGWAYKLDRLLLPAPYHTNFFNSTLDVPAVRQVLLNGDRCSETLAQGASRIANATAWPAAWERLGLGGALANESVVATLFVPQDAAAGGRKVSLETMLYNMVPGQGCPDRLDFIGSANSMLGVLTGRNLPLLFTNETGVFTVKGASNSARMVGVGRACNSLVYATDAVLEPPTLEVAPTEPIKFPVIPNRRFTCVPPTMPAPKKFTAPVNPPAPPPGDSSGGDTALAVGLGVGLGCAAILIAAAAFLFMRRRRRKEDSARKAKSEALGGCAAGSGKHLGILAPATALFALNPPRLSEIGPVSSLGSSGATHSSSGTRRSRSSYASSESADMWELNPSDLDIALGPHSVPIELGRGSFGAVYRGMLRGVQPAAIKVLSFTCDEDYEAAVKSEVSILKRVNRDRNVVQFYGTARMPDGKLLMVTELMEGGNLRAALRSSATTEQLAWHRGGKRAALDIARGLTALHANRVVHRDLKSKNILLTGGMTAKIADVGIAAVLEASKGYLTPSSGGVIGTLAWSAPELLLGERCTEKVDIYSLGIILWELATGAMPQRGLTEPPPPSERCPAGLAQLIAECTGREPESRPTAREVYERILAIPPVAEV